MQYNHLAFHLLHLFASLPLQHCFFTERGNGDKWSTFPVTLGLFTALPCFASLEFCTSLIVCLNLRLGIVVLSSSGSQGLEATLVVLQSFSTSGVLLQPGLQGSLRTGILIPSNDCEIVTPWRRSMHRRVENGTHLRQSPHSRSLQESY